MAVFCRNCGAAVVGRFCSCCGKRVRSDIEEYRLAEKRAFKEYKEQIKDRFIPRNVLLRDRSCLAKGHLADACWYLFEMKNTDPLFLSSCGDLSVRPDAYEQLEARKLQATQLFERLVDEVFQKG